MNRDELISVIVPVYNVEKYLSKCIETIINQTYKNLEIILVDDGATDKSGTICEEYAHKDARIRVIHKENGGLSDARNAGLSVATGKYISFIDSDDWIAADMYEHLHAVIVYEEADLTFGVIERVSGKSSYNISDGSQIVVTGKDILDSFIYPSRKPHILKSACDKLYRRSIIGDTRFIKGVHGEDGPFTLEILSKCKKCVFVGRAVYYYLDTREESISGHKITERLFTDRIPLLKLQIRKLEDVGRRDLAEYQICRYYEELLDIYAGLKAKSDEQGMWKNRLKCILQGEREEMLQSLHYAVAEKRYKMKIRIFIFNPTLLCVCKRLGKS
ncbi:MAG: glycosyltransferase [Lachnospiraceae bacterium]|nr:glycosyltransferase [Lachnospiraceae bacterium]